MVNFKLIIFVSVLGFNQCADNTQILLGQLFKIITYTLANGAGNVSDTRQQQHQNQNYYRPPNTNGGISSTMYKALQTIAQNDELECVSRLLCETAAGGKPGNSRQINIDKQSLTALLSYLQLDAGGNSSPMLTFGKAALLGISNRGDPYECNVNYPKCPRDQERLLYYLNNHRGGFFRFFDMKLSNNQNNNPQNNYQYQGDHQNGLHYNIYLNKIRPNQHYLMYPNKNHLYNKYRKQAKPEVYAKKYDHSSMSFSSNDYEKYSRGNKKTIVFPKDRKDVGIEERILTKIVRVPLENDYFTFSNTHRGPKNLKHSNDYKISNFFPSKDNRPAVSPTDRLPNMFYVPERGYGNPMKFPVSYVKNFFPDY